MEVAAAGADDPARPLLSAVTLGGHIDQIRTVVRALRLRAAEQPFELVVVYEHGAPPEPGEPLPDWLQGFDGVRFVQAPITSSVALGRAAGARAASGEFVLYTETHCFPEPGWAGALLAAHREGWDVVGPRFEVAQHDRVGELMLFCDYAPWFEETGRGEASFLPGHNSSYRREALLSLGDDLDFLFEAETGLQEALQERGAKMLFEPAAGVRHRNFERPGLLAPEEVAVGQMFGAVRSRHWPLWKRIAAAAATPALIPIFLKRLISRAREVGRLPLLRKHCGYLLLFVSCRALGEARGYLLGLGDSSRVLARLELHHRLGNPASDPPDPATL